MEHSSDHSMKSNVNGSKWEPRDSRAPLINREWKKYKRLDRKCLPCCDVITDRVFSPFIPIMIWIILVLDVSLYFLCSWIAFFNDEATLSLFTCVSWTLGVGFMPVDDPITISSTFLFGIVIKIMLYVCFLSLNSFPSESRRLLRRMSFIRKLVFLFLFVFSLVTVVIEGVSFVFSISCYIRYESDHGMREPILDFDEIHDSIVNFLRNNNFTLSNNQLNNFNFSRNEIANEKLYPIPKETHKGLNEQVVNVIDHELQEEKQIGMHGEGTRYEAHGNLWKKAQENGVEIYIRDLPSNFPPDSYTNQPNLGYEVNYNHPHSNHIAMDESSKKFVSKGEKSLGRKRSFLRRMRLGVLRIKSMFVEQSSPYQWHDDLDRNFGKKRLFHIDILKLWLITKLVFQIGFLMSTTVSITSLFIFYSFGLCVTYESFRLKRHEIYVKKLLRFRIRNSSEFSIKSKHLKTSRKQLSIRENVLHVSASEEGDSEDDSKKTSSEDDSERNSKEMDPIENFSNEADAKGIDPRDVRLKEGEDREKTFTALDSNREEQAIIHDEIASNEMLQKSAGEMKSEIIQHLNGDQKGKKIQKHRRKGPLGIFFKFLHLRKAKSRGRKRKRTQKILKGHSITTLDLIPSLRYIQANFAGYFLVILVLLMVYTAFVFIAESGRVFLQVLFSIFCHEHNEDDDNAICDTGSLAIDLFAIFRITLYISLLLTALVSFITTLVSFSNFKKNLISYRKGIHSITSIPRRNLNLNKGSNYMYTQASHYAIGGFIQFVGINLMILTVLAFLSLIFLTLILFRLELESWAEGIGTFINKYFLSKLIAFIVSAAFAYVLNKLFKLNIINEVKFRSFHLYNLYEMLSMWTQIFISPISSLFKSLIMRSILNMILFQRIDSTSSSSFDVFQAFFFQELYYGNSILNVTVNRIFRNRLKLENNLILHRTSEEIHQRRDIIYQYDTERDQKSERSCEDNSSSHYGGAEFNLKPNSSNHTNEAKQTSQTSQAYQTNQTHHANQTNLNNHANETNETMLHHKQESDNHVQNDLKSQVENEPCRMIIETQIPNKYQSSKEMNYFDTSQNENRAFEGKISEGKKATLRMSRFVSAAFLSISSDLRNTRFRGDPNLHEHQAFETVSNENAAYESLKGENGSGTKREDKLQPHTTGLTISNPSSDLDAQMSSPLTLDTTLNEPRNLDASS